MGFANTPDEPGPGLVDPETGRFLEARRLSPRRGLWCDHPEGLLDRSRSIDISLLGPAVPFGLLPAADPRVRRTAEAILQHGTYRGDPNALARWASTGRPMTLTAYRHNARIKSELQRIGHDFCVTGLLSSSGV